MQLHSSGREQKAKTRTRIWIPQLGLLHVGITSKNVRAPPRVTHCFHDNHRGKTPDHPTSFTGSGYDDSLSVRKKKKNILTRIFLTMYCLTLSYVHPVLVKSVFMTIFNTNSALCNLKKHRSCTFSPWILSTGLFFQSASTTSKNRVD